MKKDLERTGSEVSLFLFQLFEESGPDDYYTIQTGFEARYPNFSSAYDWLKNRILYALTDPRLSDEKSAKLRSLMDAAKLVLLQISNIASRCRSRPGMSRGVT